MIGRPDHGVREVPGLAGLGSEWDALFAAGPGVQSRRAWFEATEAAALPAGAQPLWLAVTERGAPAALLPLMRLPGGTLMSLTSPYTVLFQPLLAPGTDPFAAGLALGRHLRHWPMTRLEALDPGWAALPPFLAGLRRAGLAGLRFDHFGNWHETLGEGGWDGYLEAREGSLRSTVRRRLRAAEKMPELRHEIAREPEDIGTALAAYEAVYARSWKDEEPFPSFNPVLLPLLAQAGVLRLAVLWRGALPIAAQYWTVDGEVATVLKLAHDEAAKGLSPGTVLTAVMIRALLAEGVRALDFGRGDDPYKQGWVRERRQRVGVLLVAPWRLDGALVLARHWLGVARRRVRQLGTRG